MKYQVTKLLLLLFAAFKGNAQFSTTIPLREDVASGQLKNGMKYYVLHNEWPKDRVSFYFAQNVGAILENDDQNGLAHFLEHMAFNGSANFKKMAVVDMLEKVGVSFGSEINAYTAQDQTVYNLSNVPTTNSNLIDSCLLALHDWSGYLTLNDKDIDAERGVIREEWRTRNNSNFRLQSQIDKVLYKDSKYAKRNIIGDMNIINTFKYQTLKDYYKKWYRPDLQAVIVVGDIDVKEIEKKIIKLFSTIKMPANPTERYYVAIPKNKEMEYVLAQDKEADGIQINLYFKKDFDLVKNQDAKKRTSIEALYSVMLNRRFGEYIQNNETAVTSMASGSQEISRLSDSFILSVVPKNNKTKEGFKELMIETERANRYGFTQQELDRTKQSVLSSFEDVLQNKDKISNDNLCDGLINYFLKAESFETVEKQNENLKNRLASITLDEINEFAKKRSTQENVVLTVTGPDKKDIAYPLKSDYVNIMKEAMNMSLEKYKDVDLEQPLIKEELKGAKVLKNNPVEGISGASIYVLANGAKVVLYPTKLASDEILFSAVSKGGTSLLNTAAIPSSQIAVSLVENSGLGEFKASNLQDKIDGKIVALQAYISQLSEGFTGSSNQNDIETLLQLLYLSFEHPRFEKNAYSRILNDLNNSFENTKNTNSKVFQDTISALSTNYSKRVPLLDQKFINELSFEKAKSIYKERFQNAAEFTFVFTGNLPDNMVLLIEKYIGSISGNANKLENFADNNIEPAPGVSKQLLVREMDVPMASVYVSYMNKFPYTYKNEFCMYILSELLSKRYQNLIREGEGGSYGVAVASETTKFPVDSYSLVINFDTDPIKEEKLMKIVFEQIDLVQKKAITKEDLQSIKNALLKSRAESVLTNDFWLSKLSEVIVHKQDFKNDAIFSKTLNEITTEDIKKFAAEFFKDSKSVQVIMTSKFR